MQTFLPYKDFAHSVYVLDYRRLGKQRVEAMQILQALEPNSPSRWKNHPAVRMWRGHEAALRLYHDLTILEWTERGYNNNMKLRANLDDHFTFNPPWLTDEFCRAHQSNLLRKDPVFYGKYGWDVPHDLPYIWPV
jgi:hypothetical protein